MTRLLVLSCFLAAAVSARAFSSADATATAGAYSTAFYTVNGTNGYFKDTQTGGIAYFWGQAEMIECVIDAYEWTSNPAHQAMITNLLNGFLSNNGSSWSGNMYNDDIMWAVIAFARGGVDTGKPGYCAIAKNNFDACYARAWDNTLGGGLYWTTDNNTKNACVNGPGSIAASLLYQIYGDTNYLVKATNIYAWERSVLFNPNTGAIYDAIGTNGVINYWSSTYNQGTFIGAADFLGQTNDASLAARFTMMNLTGGGILPEYGIAGNNSGFNAIYLRWFTRFVRGRNLQSRYAPWLQLNANAAWNVRRPSDCLSWCQWAHPSPAGTNFYSWDCISSFEVLHAAAPSQVPPALPVPANYIGYWPLDATSGTSANDASGSGNTGLVSGATWSSSGRFNGCLSFNGVNSSVRVANPVANDFSIALWVKTAQTAGTGQWYNGKGLVDGDVPSNNNDFGTALVGGKFAFGVGNPDTTILSANSINDGAWHLCVATRELATGAMKVYVDGGLQGSGAGNRNSLRAPAQLLFGAIASGGGYFSGSLDDVKIFTRALTASEVSALYYTSLNPPPSAPASLAATAGNARVQLSWWEASAATSYNIKRSLNDGGPYVTITNVATTAFADASVVNNRTYYYVVSAVNSIGEGNNSAQASASPSPLAVWFKADAITNLSNGAAVPAWTDSTGHGYNATQTVDASQPTYVTSAINGLPVVRFSSARSSFLWFYRPVSDDFTFIFVYQSSQGVGTGTDFWSGAGLVNGEVGGTVGDFGTSLNANGQLLAGTGSPDSTARSGTGFNDGRPHVVTFKRTRSTGAIVLYVDGTVVGTATGGTQSLTAPNQLVLGAQQTLNNFLNGDIAEVQIYSSALPDADRLAQERALKCKYGLTGGATPLAPTGLAGVAGNRQISLTWLLTVGASSYNLWRSTDNGATYQAIATGLTNSSYLDTQAANGKVNYYRVAGVDACGAGAFSATVPVPLPLPALTMGATTNSMTIGWPAWANDWGLWSATNLTAPVLWTPVTSPVSSNNGMFRVTVPIGSGDQFFRLSSP